jgi:hypothetical protein
MLLELAASTLAIHVLPNVVMKAVKSTKVGHKLLTSTFALGIEHGKEGKKFQFNFKSVIEFGIGPEALAEYHLGVKIGKELKNVPTEYQHEFLLAFKASVETHMESLNEEDKEIVEETPILSAIVSYIEGEYSNTIATTKKFSVEENKKTSITNIAGNVAMVAVVGAVNFHLLAQPIISYIRKKLATSKFGKNLMKKNYEKGLEGQKLSKFQSLAIDLLVSPAVLDTMKIGNTINKVESMRELERIID